MMFYRASDFIGTTPDANQIMIGNSRLLGYGYLDPSSNREVTFRHGFPYTAKYVNDRYVNRCVEYALQGRNGYFFENFSSEEYEAFNDAFERYCDEK